MKRIIEVGGLRVKPGEVGFGQLDCTSLRDSQAVGVPIMVMNGTEEGPTFWIQAAIHGQEIPGIEVIRRLVREEIDPRKLRGTLLAVPTANPLAFQAGTQYAPQDNVDAHNVFPGNAGKSVSHQLAHLLYTEGIMKCDYFVDIHANCWPAIMFIPVPVHGDDGVVQKSVQMAEAFGGLPVCEARNVPGWPSAQAQAAGKPAFVVELLYLGWIDPEAVEVGVEGMKNVLKYLGMLEGASVPLPSQKVPTGRYGRQFIFSKHGGLVSPKKSAGDHMRKGDLIAVIRDPFGNIVEEVTSPAEGYVRTVLFGNPNQAICAGEVLYSYLEVGERDTFFIV